MAVCDEEKKNLGVGRCLDLPGIIRSWITTPKNWSVSFESALLEATWQNAMLAPKANRIYKWPEFADIPEFTGSETVYNRNAVAVSVVLDGKYEWLARISKSLCFHKAAFSHRSTEGRVILIDHNGNLFGTKVGNNFAGFTFDMLHSESLRFSDGTVESGSPIRLSLANPNEVNHFDYGMIRVAPTWNVSSLNVLTDVELTIISASATEIVVDVKQVCDGTEVLGLDDTDFLLLTEDGDPQTITAASEVNGRYTLTGVDLESGTLDLIAAADLSVQAYENVEPTEVTIS